jgi:hypothetical protein
VGLIEFRIKDDGSIISMVELSLTKEEFVKLRWDRLSLYEKRYIGKKRYLSILDSDISNNGYTIWRDFNNELVIIINELNWPEGDLQYLKNIWIRERVLVSIGIKEVICYV